MSEDDTQDDEHQRMVDLLSSLRLSHRQLDDEITALRETGAVDMVNVARMKKIKLRLKDRIAALEDILTPDIIA
jgi:hypothetical protein